MVAMKFAMNEATLMKTDVPSFLDACARAGFDGVELRRDEVLGYLEHQPVDALKRLLDKASLEVVSWNAIELFSLCSEDAFDHILAYTKKLMEIGNMIGCDTIIAVPSFLDGCLLSKEQVFDTTVKRFQVLRRLAADRSFKMAFEPLGFPSCSVRTIPAALKVLEAAEADGLGPSGLVIDTFHFFLAGHAPQDLLSIPPDRLWLVHFNDSVQKPLDTLQDGDRVWPGAGFFELESFMRALKQRKYDGYVSIELFNSDYWQQDPVAVAREALASVKRYA